MKLSPTAFTEPNAESSFRSRPLEAEDLDVDVLGRAAQQAIADPAADDQGAPAGVADARAMAMAVTRPSVTLASGSIGPRLTSAAGCICAPADR